MNRIKSSLSRVTIEHVWIITVLSAIIIFLNTHPIRPHDFWWHAAIGREILTTKSIPSVDVYSFTALGQSYPSYNQFWLAEVVLFLVYDLGGPILIVLMQALIVGSAYFLLAWICQRKTHNFRATAFSILVAAALGFGSWNVRPQAISYLLGVMILVGILEQRASSPRRSIWLFPVTMAIWVNSHGSFLIGLVMIGIWLADEVWEMGFRWIRTKTWGIKHLAPAVTSLVLAVAGCVLNPIGFGFVKYFSTMAGNPIIQNFVPEWSAPSFDNLDGIFFYLAFMAIAVLLALSPKRPDFFQLVLFIIFGVLGLRYIRGSVWFGIAMAPVIADHLAAVFSHLGLKPAGPPSPGEQRINTLFVASMLLLVVLSLPWFKAFWPVVPEKKGLISAETPVEAAQFLINRRLPSQVFHDMAFGSYLIWKAYPDYKVFVDSRIELFPAAVWEDYFQLSNALGDWEAKLSGYGINTLMLSWEDQSYLVEAVSQSDRWEKVYQDQAAIIFSRR